MKLYFFLLLLNSFNIYLSFNCGINKLPKISPLSVNVSKGKNDRRLGDTMIKIYIDYKMIENSPSITQENKDKIKTSLNKVISLFQKIIRVKNSSGFVGGIPAEQMDIFKQNCYVTETTLDMTENHPYDLIIFPSFTNILEDGVEAAATYCVTEDYKRPVVGFVLINKDINFSKGNSDKYFEYLLLHEITHVLVFSNSLFKKFPNGAIYEQGGKTYINSTKVVEKAKNHFGCNDIIGVQLENQGGEGSAGDHWEARVMLGDYMISTDYPEVVISEISLALFEDSGWYEVNYYTGGLFRYGKGEGCLFLTEKCVQNEVPVFENEFCSYSYEPRCTTGRLSKGSCYLSYYSYNINSEFSYYSDNKKGGWESADFCPIADKNSKTPTFSNNYYHQNCMFGKEIDNDAEEVIGSNSVCVISSLSNNGGGKIQPICYPLTCDYFNKKHSFTVFSTIIECPLEGGIISNINGLTGHFMCPGFNDVCTSEISCSDLEDCVEKSAEPYSETFTYSYIPNRDLKDLKTYEEIQKNGDNKLYINILLFLTIIFLF